MDLAFDELTFGNMIFSLETIVDEITFGKVTIGPSGFDILRNDDRQSDM